MMATNADGTKLLLSETSTMTIKKSRATVVELAWSRKQTRVSKARAVLPDKNSAAECQNLYDRIDFLSIEIRSSNPAFIHQFRRRKIGDSNPRNITSRTSLMPNCYVSQKGRLPPTIAAIFATHQTLHATYTKVQ